MKFVLFSVFFLLVVIAANAQITGTITDSKSKRPVENVEVFVHRKTVSALSDHEGQFILDAVQPGFVDLVLYKKGYQIFKSSIHIVEGKAYAVNLTLEPAKKEKGTKLLTSGDLQKFKEALFGKEHLGKFTLLNEKALSFVNTADGIQLKSDEPLLIDNTSLGYQLRYYLLNGVTTPAKTTVQGYFTFIPIQGTGSEQVIQWSTNRLGVYAGSLRHLFKSLIAGKTDEEGFEFLNSQGTAIKASTLIAPSIPNYHTIKIDNVITVRFKSITGEIVESHLTPQGSLQINDEGILLIPQNLEVTGAMAINSNPLLLPQDYQPIVPQPDDFMRYYEKIYVQTDKPYYYPGEPLWFKGYINYFTPSWRDSLSKVVYVELIHPKKTILLSKTLRIDSGLFHGDFILPDTLSSGGYSLRAYTQLSRNYGDENLFIKSIPLLKMTDKADPAQAVVEAPADNGLTITADKPSYKTREKITLTLQLRDKEGKPMASNLSVSVTDAIQVIAIPESQTILNNYGMDKTLSFKDIKFNYPVEFGVGYTGRFLNDRGKPEKTFLTVLRMKPRNATLVETDDEGYFYQTGLQFTDTASFSFKSDKAKDRPYGKVELTPRETPAIHIKNTSAPLEILQTETAQRLISEYEVPKDTKLLQVVEVKASRLPRDETEEPDYRENRSYGIPDYTIREQDIKAGYGNLIYSLIGRVPGLVVRPEANYIGFSRAATQSVFFGSGPLVTINNVQMSGDPYQTISAINPSTVQSIEITKRINVAYGSLGANGVIAIFTKQGTTGYEDIKVQNFQTLLIRGYSKSRHFLFPLYDNPTTDATQADYRATLYWSPTLTTDSKTGMTTTTFFSADLPGKYRVVVEGIDGMGKPIRGVYFIEVGD